MTPPLKREDFDPLLGQTLPLQAGAQPLDATLVEVRTLESPSPREATPFALTFVVTGSTPAAQGTFCLTHPKLGAVELFMVPIGRDDDGTRFEAIFN